jgi:peptidoglycan-associated lipoprotein
MSYFKLIAIALLGASLAGCPANTLPDPEPTDTTYGSDGGADTSPSGGDGMGGGEFFDESMEELGTVIYFEFDSSDVRAQDQDLVAAHAIALNADSYVSVRLEGHADERGSREYNIGLGERRAQAVRQMLMIQGVGASQIQTVSFGEERPDSMGSSESDYAMNRRVEIKYTN